MTLMFWSRLSWPVWNNAFVYAQRCLDDPDPKLRIPSCKTIATIKEVEQGTEPVFAELNKTGDVMMFTGLKHMYVLQDGNTYLGTNKHLPPTYIFDNHNYALYLVTKHLQRFPHLQEVSLIHIDQHSDLWPTPQHTPIPDFTTCSDETLFDYAVKTCNVGNFINPALDAWIIWSCNWIKNQYNLESHFDRDRCDLSQQTAIRLDIDLDFWAPGMGTNLEKTIPLVRTLMREASLVTIATSPYFLDQSYAIMLLETIFYDGA